MAKERLTTGFVRAVTVPSRYGDGGRGSFGLSLLVRLSPASGLVKTWQQRYRKADGKYSSRVLGVYPDVSLEQARADAVRFAMNGDVKGEPPEPIAPARHELQASVVLPPASAAVEVEVENHPDSFRRVFNEALQARSKGFKPGSKSAKQSKSIFEQYVPRELGDRPIDQVKAADLVRCLDAVWYDSPTSAQKLVQGLNATFNRAMGLDLIDASPLVKARLVLGPLKNRTKHFASLPHAEVGAAIETINATDAWLGTKLCFRLLVLTATRSSEVRLATWNEIDTEAQTWTIPADRMKMETAHRVPLSTQALDVLRQAGDLSDSKGLIFPSERGKELSDSTLSKLLKENGIAGTPHGCRTSWRVWAAEQGYPYHLCEMALAHKAGSDIALAYLRTDLLSQRGEIMQDWADYLQG